MYMKVDIQLVVVDVRLQYTNDISVECLMKNEFELTEFDEGCISSNKI